jgi:hypothetical protein
MLLLIQDALFLLFWPAGKELYADMRHGALHQFFT